MFELSSIAGNYYIGILLRSVNMEPYELREGEAGAIGSTPAIVSAVADELMHLEVAGYSNAFNAHACLESHAELIH